MKLEDILLEWEKDSVIDPTQITRESLKAYELHSKYLRMLTEEKTRRDFLDKQFKKLKLEKTEYYSGNMSIQDMNDRDWKPFNRRILKGDVSSYVEVDEDITKLLTRVEIQKQKIEVLETIMKMVMNRGFHIKNYIENEKFLAGVM